ncbi:MAG: rod shape-determining protein MreD [Syntrophaceae bacterium]|nr:rod shape-determining protein MreD [Syntrophaceae bacterium]
MIYYILLLISSVFLIVLQSMITDIIFSNYFMFEISLVIVIYAGFHLDLMKGTVMAFLLGLFVDCVGGAILGLYPFVYIIVFWSSFFISDLMDTEKTHVVIFFSFFCVLLKEIMLNTFYYMAYNINLFLNTYYIIFTHALVISLVAPLIFYLMDRTGIFLYEN